MMKRKLLIAVGITAGTLLLIAVILLISGPKLQVVKNKESSGETTYSVYVVNFSLRMLYSGYCDSLIERWNGETWEPCPLNSKEKMTEANTKSYTIFLPKGFIALLKNAGTMNIITMSGLKL